MFAYCNNCPLILSDTAGDIPTTATWGLFEELLKKVKELVAKDREGFSPINGQSVSDFGVLDFGWFNLSTNGCGPVAIYNALGLTGQPVYLGDVLGYLDCGWPRPFGTMPYEIGSCLTHFGATYTEADSLAKLSALMENGGTAIVVLWNEATTTFGIKYPNILAGAHTMTVVHDGNGAYTVYNRYSNRAMTYTRQSLEEFVGSEVNYIAGFYLG